MKRLLFLLCCLLLTSGLFAQSWLWARQSKNDNTYSYATSTDVSGNIYVTGYFTNSVEFSGQTITTSGGREIYVAKYDGNGNLLWIKTGGCNKPNVFDQGNGVVADASGNVYVVGDFGDTASFDGMQVIATPAIIANASNCFLAKYDASGAIQWVRSIGSASNGTATGLGIALDGNNDVVITGTYFGTTNVDTIAIGGCTNCSNVFVAKYNPSGDALWAKSSNASSLVIDFGRVVATDAQNNVIIAGQMTGGNTFGSISLNGFGGSDIYIAKYDANGAFLWAKEAGGVATGDDLKGIGTDATGNIYLSGNFVDGAKFGSITMAGPASGSDLFLAKMTPAGAFSWVKKADAAGCILLNMHTTDNGDNYLCGIGTGGSFGGLTVPVGSFIVKYDKTGVATSYKMLPAFAGSWATTIHPSGDIISTGTISGGNPVFDNDTLSGNGFTTNMYVARLSGLTTGIEAESAAGTNIRLFPNPAANDLFVQGSFGEDSHAWLTDLSGRMVAQYAPGKASTGFHMDLQSVSAGLYVVKIFNNGTVSAYKLVISR